VAKKQQQKSNPLVEFFTHDHYMVMNKIKFGMESIFYDYYKYKEVEGLVMLGVKSTSEDIADLKGGTIDSRYNEYVVEAKNSKAKYGVQLEFIYEDNRKQEEEDDL